MRALDLQTESGEFGKVHFEVAITESSSVLLTRVLRLEAVCFNPVS
jgi:hypothetical protein